MKKLTIIRQLSILFVAIYLCLLLYHNPSIWSDEYFTLNIISLPFKDMMQAIKVDAVHPPLYYILLKLYTKALWFIQDPFVRTKSFSSFCVLVALLHGSNHIKKSFNEETSLYFILFAATCQVIGYAVEIRMYTLSMYFVLMCALYIYDLLKQYNPKTLLKLTIYTILAIYTHYFTFIFVGLFYLHLMVVYIKRKEFKLLLPSILIILISYIPWIFAVTSTIHSGFKDAAPMTTIYDFLNFAVYPFFVHNKILTAVIFGFTITLIFNYVFKTTNKNHYLTILLFAPLITLVTGVILSILTGKFFNGKYLLPGMLAFDFALAYICSKLSTKKLYLTMQILLLLSSYLTIFQFEQNDRIGYATIQSLESYKDVTIHASGDLYDILSLYPIDWNLEKNLVQQDNDIYIIYTDYQTDFDKSQMILLNHIQFGGSNLSIYQRKASS